MSGTLSKRQQARNEKLLQDLVHNVPGNNQCADCHTPNPAWASWSLGVFLCMRCAATHRKLGTHISKVKSLSMDSWSNEQVDNMRKVGNVASIHIYNPENKKPPISVDADEADSAMERFIRQKYVNNVAKEPGKPQSPHSDEGTPPPLPPKNTSKFGFRSASSIFPLSSRAKEAKMAAVMGTRSSTSPNLTNKPSKVFGATVDLDAPDNADRKLAKLRDMGFHDGQRNAIVLKGVNGSLERAVEALVRLGEGSTPSPALATTGGLQMSRSLTSMTSKSTGSGVGLSIPQKSTPERPTTVSTSTNPFDMLIIPPLQTAQSTGNLQTKNPYNNVAYSMNPFGQPSQQVDVGKPFQGPTVSAPPETLFPHRTGEVGAQAHQSQPLYQQYMSPSAPPSPSYFQPMSFRSSVTYPQPTQQHPTTGYNPFFSQSSSPPHQTQSPQPNLCMGASPMVGPVANNPFARSPTRIASPALGQIPEQGLTSFLTASPLPPPTNTNPFFVNATQASAQQMGQQQPLQHQPRQRQDKASIMALYDWLYQAPPPKTGAARAKSASADWHSCRKPGRLPAAWPSGGTGSGASWRHSTTAGRKDETFFEQRGCAGGQQRPA